MAVVWQLKLKNHSGALVALIDDFVGLEIKEPVNGVGEYALQMKGDDPDCALFGLDYQVEAWWRDLDAGIAWRREIEAFHRDGYWSVAADGKLVFSSVGVGYVDLLRRTTSKPMPDRQRRSNPAPPRRSSKSMWTNRPAPARAAGRGRG